MNSEISSCYHKVRTQSIDSKRVALAIQRVRDTIEEIENSDAQISRCVGKITKRCERMTPSKVNAHSNVPESNSEVTRETHEEQERNTIDFESWMSSASPCKETQKTPSTIRKEENEARVSPVKTPSVDLMPPLSDDRGMRPRRKPPPTPPKVAAMSQLRVRAGFYCTAQQDVVLAVKAALVKHEQLEEEDAAFYHDCKREVAKLRHGVEKQICALIGQLEMERARSAILERQLLEANVRLKRRYLKM